MLNSYFTENIFGVHYNDGLLALLTGKKIVVFLIILGIQGVGKNKNL